MRKGVFRLVESENFQPIYSDETFKVFLVNSIQEALAAVKDLEPFKYDAGWEGVRVLDKPNWNCFKTSVMENAIGDDAFRYAYGDNPCYIIQQWEGDKFVDCYLIRWQDQGFIVNSKEFSSYSQGIKLSWVRKLPKPLLSKIKILDTDNPLYGTTFADAFKIINLRIRTTEKCFRKNNWKVNPVEVGVFRTKAGLIINSANVIVGYESSDLSSNLIIPDGIAGIQKPSVTDTTKLRIKSITIPSSVKFIGPSTFQDVDSLSEVAFSEGLEFIGRRAFAGTSIKEAIIPNSVTALEYDIFLKCSELKRIHVPEKITTIPEKFAKLCSSLEDVNIPSTVKIIGAEAFRDCSSLEDVDLPEGLTKISNSAFNNSGLVTVSLPASLKAIDYCVFQDCTALRHVEAKEGMKLDKIESSVFAGCKRLSRVKNIGAFAKGERAFEGCTALKNIADFRAMKALVSPEDFPEEALQGEVVLPDTVVAVRSFGNIDTITSIKFGKGLKRLHYLAFDNCKNLKVVDLSECTELRNVEYGAFRDCKALETVIFADTVNPKCKLDKSVFDKCTNLKTVKLPNNLLCIPEACFRECTQLSEINVPVKLRVVDNEAFVGTSIKEFKFPRRFSLLGKRSFQNCANLTSIEIPAGVGKIPGSCFRNCINLQKVTATDNLSDIGREAFADCTKLADFEIQSTDPDFDQFEDVNYSDNAFSKTPYLEILKAADVYDSNGELIKESFRR